MLLTWIRDGGPFVVPLLLIGAVSLVLLVERTAYIVIRSKIHARPFIERVISLVRAGKQDEALALCADHQAAIPDLGLVVLRSGRTGERDLASVAESATLAIIPDLTRRLAWLPALGVVAVLLALVGSVANLHEALMQSTSVPLAIAYALRPLGLGLTAAIPCVAGHAYLMNEARKLTAQLNEFSVRLVNALVDRPDVRLGHRG